MTEATDKATARAATAETLADKIEATSVSEQDVDAEHAIAALLLGPEDARAHSKQTKNGVISIVVNASNNPVDLPARWRGAHRGTLRRDFATNLDGVLALIDRVFGPEWGFDVVRWPKAGPDVATGPLGVYDAELTPPAGVSALGQDLIGQHTSAGGALLAALLRAYAFKLKSDAGILAPFSGPDMIGGVRFDIDETQRAFIADIVDRAEEAGLSAPELRTDRMMDFAAVHCNGCPIDFEGLLHHASDFAFAHDFNGIVENIDRTTGKLQNHFLPRFAVKEAASGDQITDEQHATLIDPPKAEP